MSHYYSEKQESPFALRKVHFRLGSQEYIFFTGSGVFSKRRIDYGTALLAKEMRVASGDRVLDLGCGIGVLGRVAADAGAREVVLVDLNARAVRLAKMNTEGLGHVRVLHGDGYAALQGECFSVILLNPPQSAGKKLCLQFIREAKEHLVPGGSLQLVARHHVGGGVLSKYMEEIFGNVETIVKKGGYRVYLSRA